MYCPVSCCRRYVFMDRNFCVAAKWSLSLFFSQVILLSGDMACIGVPVFRYKAFPRAEFFRSVASFLARLSDQAIAFPSGTPFLSIDTTLCMAELKQMDTTSNFLG